MPDPIWRHQGFAQADYGCFWLEPQTTPTASPPTFDGDVLLHQGDGRIGIRTGIQYGRVRVTIELWPQPPAVVTTWEEHESLTVDWPPECEVILLRVDEYEVAEIPDVLGPTGVTVWCRNRDQAAELDQSGEEADGVAEFLVALYPVATTDPTR